MYCEQYRRDFVRRTFALIAPVQPILHRVSCSKKRSQMRPTTTKCTKTWVKGPMGWIGCVLCEKFRHDFVARTVAIIAPVQPVLHQVSCSNETIPNAPKHYKTHQNICLRYNGVNRVRSLRKIPTWPRYTNVCINFAISARFTPSFKQQWNDPKCTEALRNTPKHRFTVQWDELGVFVVHNSATTSWHKQLHYMHQFSPLCTKFHA
jgi:hypothetical protein